MASHVVNLKAVRLKDVEVKVNFRIVPKKGDFQGPFATDVVSALTDVLFLKGNDEGVIFEVGHFIVFDGGIFIARLGGLDDGDEGVGVTVLKGTGALVVGDESDVIA